MRTFLPGTDAWIEPNNLSVAGRSFTLTIGSAYERVTYIYNQIFASTADEQHLRYRHAPEWDITPKDAAPAQGFISFTETAGPYVTLPAGYSVARPDGLRFVFLGDAVPDASGHCSVEIRATVNGASTNTLPGTPMTFAADPAYPNLPSQAIVGNGGLGAGADAEDKEALRARILFRKRNPPHGGAAPDYVQWATAVPGCTRAFVSAFSPPSGALTLYPLFDTTRTNGIPTQADLTAVANALGPRVNIVPTGGGLPVLTDPSLEGPKPVAARVYVVAANALAVPITISRLQNDSPQLRRSIFANLQALFDERVPVATIDNGFTLPVAWINEAIARADGYVRHTLIAPAGDVNTGPGQLAVLHLPIVFN
jgi:uncharacterized phage protein gp47/JayE